MKFSSWFVTLAALMPIFILFAGLSAAGGFVASVDWIIVGIRVTAGVVAAGVVTAWLART